MVKNANTIFICKDLNSEILNEIPSEIKINSLFVNNENMFQDEDIKNSFQRAKCIVIDTSYNTYTNILSEVIKNINKKCKIYSIEDFYELVTILLMKVILVIYF